jgi:hypothetical protein
MFSNKTKRVMSDQKLIAGIKKNLAKSPALVLMGRKLTMGEILAMLEARVEAAGAVETSRGAWQALVVEERKTVDETEPFLDALRQYLVAVHGNAPGTLAEYGIAVHKRRALSSEEKAAKAKKARATRKARHMADVAPVNADAAGPTVPAAPAAPGA